MTNLGRLIRAVRYEKKVSVKELCQDICSDRFLYMVEKGEKFPSCLILNEFSKRLDVSLFEYIEYYECDEPVKSKKYVQRSSVLRSKQELEGLSQLRNDLLKHRDRDKTPIKNEINIIEVYLEVYKYQAFDKAIKLIAKNITESSNVSVAFILSNGYLTSDLYIISMLNLLLTCYKKMHAEDLKAQLINVLMRNIQVVASNADSKELYISILNDFYYNQIFVKKSSDYYDKIMALIDYQYDNTCLNQIFFTFYVLAGYYCDIKDYHKSKHYFEKSIASCYGLNSINHYNEFVSNLSGEFLKEVCPESFLVIEITKRDKYKDL